MKQTRVLDLRTREDVRTFCKALLQAKELAPVSVTFTVAITIDRTVQTKLTTNGRAVADPLDLIFAEVDAPLPAIPVPEAAPITSNATRKVVSRPRRRRDPAAARAARRRAGIRGRP